MSVVENAQQPALSNCLLAYSQRRWEWAEIGVAEDWAYVMRKAGFNLISDIKDEKAQGLQQKIGEINKKYKLGYEKPSVEDIQAWIDKANV